ncbi:hypothetical protein ACU4GD_41645 [Cupriavidus basilensis]
MLRRRQGISCRPAISLTEIWRHPLHTREEFNDGRSHTIMLHFCGCLQLELLPSTRSHARSGVTELVGWERSARRTTRVIAAVLQRIHRRAGARARGGCVKCCARWNWRRWKERARLCAEPAAAGPDAAASWPRRCRG